MNDYINAINRKNLKEIRNLTINNTNEKIDILLKIYQYNKNSLTSKGLKFIIRKCSDYFDVSTTLIKELIKDNNVELLNAIFEIIKIYDVELILNFLFHYRNKKPLSSSGLSELISNEKYKVPIFHETGTLYKSPLFFACESGNESIAKYLIKLGFDFKEHNEYGETAFLYACKSGNLNLVKYLVEHGADINSESSDFSSPSPLYYSFLSGNTNLVKYVVEQGADINQLFHYNKSTVLYDACENENESMVKCLVELGIDINEGDPTPLSEVCSNRNETLIKYLVEHGADVNKGTFFKYDGKCTKPLYVACYMRNESLVKYLVEHGADINSGSYTALYEACKQRNNDTIVKYLVEHGAEVNSGNYTPLSAVCKVGNIMIVKYLVEHGADINRIGLDEENTPLYEACERKNETIVKYLVEELGADLNKGIITPLYVACATENESLVKYLVEHGADVNKREYDNNNEDGFPQYRMQPLYAASSIAENENIVKYLIEKGAIVNEKILLDKRIKNRKIKKYLKERGAKEPFNLPYHNLDGYCILS